MSALDDLFDGLPKTLSVREAATLLNVRESMVRDWINQKDQTKRLPALQVDRKILILTQDFHRWLAQRYTDPDLSDDR